MLKIYTVNSANGTILGAFTKPESAIAALSEECGYVDENDCECVLRWNAEREYVEYCSDTTRNWFERWWGADVDMPYISTLWVWDN